MYAPLDPSVLKLQLQISDVDSSALQLVPLQHTYIYIFQLSRCSSLPLGGTGEEIFLLFLIILWGLR